MLQGLLFAAERFLQRYARRHFETEPALVDGEDTANPVAKTFVVVRGRSVIRIPDLRAAASVVLDGLTLNTSTGYVPLDTGWEPATSISLYEPYGVSAGGWPLSSGYGEMVITGRWGWNPVPDDVIYAIKALTIRLYKERNASWADAVALPDGSLLQYFRQLPATVQGAINTYRKPNLAIATPYPVA